ncbi:glycine dehydrogenase [Acrasis kona]|uniref:Glycine dehydrogenase n=1 Tax=Acrasis kona TaxID=1008807 RepID=A0AAW2YWQ3_9EUKA
MKRTREYDDDKENTLMDEPIVKRTKGNTTPIKRNLNAPLRRMHLKRNVLSDAVNKQVIRLGASLPMKINPKPYRDNHYAKPAPMQCFEDTTWPLNASYKSRLFGFKNIVFKPTELQGQWSNILFLNMNQDAFVFAHGDVLLVTKMRPHEPKVDHSNFEVWIIQDERRHDGPYNLSEVLSSLELANAY